MKKALLIAALIISTGSCTSQELAKNYGGSATISLKPGQKLVMITWKDNNLWLLTRNARPEERQESYTLQESSSYGVFEGKVTIQEK